MQLVIVESPTKAKTISKFLGKNYAVKSSYGHLRDLPKSKLGVDIEKNFQPEYIIPTKRKKIVNELTKEVKKAEGVILATDEDREGEAIAWHLITALKIPTKKARRITFHEITSEALKTALTNQREINQHLVDAQQARRVLDRLVGYKLSPFLWKKVYGGLSAGRVQSVAVRLIVERERERQNFIKTEYWTLEADFQTTSQEILKTKLHTLNKKTLKKFDLKNKPQVDEIISKLPENYKITNIESKATIKKPEPPFTTSTLQQVANRRFGFSARMTMRLAQQLYEGLPIGEKEQTGLITYMRTDSLSLSKTFIEQARNYIKKSFQERYLEKVPRVYKTKSKLAQEAHEAIRPTNPELHPETIKKYLDDRQFKLYELIWQRALACQMAEARLKQVIISLFDQTKTYGWQANGQTLEFDGFLKIWPSEVKENILPQVKVNETVTLQKTYPEQHFTEPPPRFRDASLIKALEEYGIGRPSTYAPTIATIIERGYVEREQKRLNPTDVAFLVNDILVEHFPEIVDFKFTAKMEDDLDAIAEGKTAWQPVIDSFYKPFAKNLSTKEKELSKKEITEETTDKECPRCGKALIIKMGRFGKFYSCTGYPDCRHTANITKETDVEIDKKCPECGNQLLMKRGRYGAFLGCSDYPDCRYIENAHPKLDITCPVCETGELVVKKTKKGKQFYACNNYPECQFALWEKPVNEKCPECSSLLVGTAKDKLKCSNKACKFTKESTVETVKN